MKHMQTYIALIRGINVGGHKQVKMAELKTKCESLGLRDVRTLLQSGNVVFRTSGGDRAKLAKKIEAVLGVDAKVILRTAEELRSAVAKNPMVREAESDPSHFIVTFLAARPAATAMTELRDAYNGPETMQLHGAELYIHYGRGVGTSKLTNTLIERKLGVAGTARNWNTVTKLAALAE